MNDEATSELVRAYAQLHPGAFARALEAAPPKDAARAFSHQSLQIEQELVKHFQADRAAAIVATLEDGPARELLEVLESARSARMLARMAPPARERLLELVTPARRAELEQILQYPPSTAGSLMDTRVATFHPDSTVASAIDRIAAIQDRRISDLVLAGPDDHYIGLVRLQDVVGVDGSRPLSTLMTAQSPSVRDVTPRDEVVEVLKTHRLTSLPVVDIEGRLVGIIRHAGLVDAAQQSASADIQQMAGGSAEERALSSVVTKVKSRLPWLNINLLTAFAASAVVGLFENTIAQFTALAVLLPVVAGQSGNTGAQALAVTMRGLALREVRASHAGVIALKELGAGLVNGIAIALVTAGGVYLWSRNFGLAVVMIIAMVSAMMIASVAGGMIPIVLQKLGRDPATASSIILTTVTDIAGFFSFLGLATLLADLIAG